MSGRPGEAATRVRATFLAALAVVLGASSAPARALPVPGAAPRSAAPIMRQPQVTGNITWKGARRPSAADACSSFKVSAWDPAPATTPPGSIGTGAAARDLGLRDIVNGDVRKGRCYYLISGLPVGREVYISVRYAGAMGEGGPNATKRFVLQHKVPVRQDVVVTFGRSK